MYKDSGSKMYQFRRCRVGFATLSLAVLAAAQAVRATILVVTSTADSGPGSLRDTVAAASNGDTIQFDAALNGQAIYSANGNYC